MHYFIYGFTVLLVGLSYYFLGKAAKSVAVEKDNSGLITLRVHQFFKVFSYVLFAFGLILAIGPSIFPDGTEQGLLMMITAVGCVFIVISVLVNFLAKNHFLKHNEERIEIQTTFKNYKSLEIEDIVKVSHSGITNAITFKLRTGKKISCSQFLVGIVNLLELIERKNQLDLKKIKLTLQFGMGKK
ncbi:MAG: hypothetical protein ACJAZ2_002012 [Glaciecola sp.]|jgi:hypothetical protein